MPIPVIQTDRLILRPLREDDAEDMYAYAQDPLVAEPGMWKPFDSFADCQLFVLDLLPSYEGDLMWWALEHKGDHKMIGRVQLSSWSRSDARAELSFALNRDYWHQGLMTEASRAAITYGWETLNLHRIWAKVYADNAPSTRVLVKLGMRQEARLRDECRVGDVWKDLDIYAVLRAG